MDFSGSSDIPPRRLLRPDTWATGHRSALAIVVALDPDPGNGHALSQHNDAAGADRLLSMLADLDIAPTVVVDPDSPYRVPVPDGVIVDGAVRAGGAEVDLDNARSAVSVRLGAGLRGVVLAEGAEPEQLELSGLWVMERQPAPLPQRTEHGTVVIPYTAWWDDAIWLDPQRPSPPSALLEAWSLSLASVRTRGELMVVSLSARVAGLPGSVETVQRFLDEAVGAGDVWITNATAVANRARSASGTAQE